MDSLSTDLVNLEQKFTWVAAAMKPSSVAIWLASVLAQLSALLLYPSCPTNSELLEYTCWAFWFAIMAADVWAFGPAFLDAFALIKGLVSHNNRRQILALQQNTPHTTQLPMRSPLVVHGVSCLAVLALRFHTARGSPLLTISSLCRLLAACLWIDGLPARTQSVAVVSSHICADSAQGAAEPKRIYQALQPRTWLNTEANEDAAETLSALPPDALFNAGPVNPNVGCSAAGTIDLLQSIRRLRSLAKARQHSTSAAAPDFACPAGTDNPPRGPPAAGSGAQPTSTRLANMSPGAAPAPALSSTVASGEIMEEGGTGPERCFPLPLGAHDAQGGQWGPHMRRRGSSLQYKGRSRSVLLSIKLWDMHMGGLASASQQLQSAVDDAVASFNAGAGHDSLLSQKSCVAVDGCVHLLVQLEGLAVEGTLLSSCLHVDVPQTDLRQLREHFQQMLADMASRADVAPAHSFLSPVVVTPVPDSPGRGTGAEPQPLVVVLCGGTAAAAAAAGGRLRVVVSQRSRVLLDAELAAAPGWRDESQEGAGPVVATDAGVEGDRVVELEVGPVSGLQPGLVWVHLLAPRGCHVSDTDSMAPRGCHVSDADSMEPRGHHVSTRCGGAGPAELRVLPVSFPLVVMGAEAAEELNSCFRGMACAAARECGGAVCGAAVRAAVFGERWRSLAVDLGETLGNPAGADGEVVQLLLQWLCENALWATAEELVVSLAAAGREKLPPPAALLGFWYPSSSTSQSAISSSTSFNPSTNISAADLHSVWRERSRELGGQVSTVGLRRRLVGEGSKAGAAPDANCSNGIGRAVDEDAELDVGEDGVSATAVPALTLRAVVLGFSSSALECELSEFRAEMGTMADLIGLSCLCVLQAGVAWREVSQASTADHVAVTAYFSLAPAALLAGACLARTWYQRYRGALLVLLLLSYMALWHLRSLLGMGDAVIPAATLALMRRTGFHWAYQPLMATAVQLWWVQHVAICLAGLPASMWIIGVVYDGDVALTWRYGVGSVVLCAATALAMEAQTRRRFLAARRRKVKC